MVSYPKKHKQRGQRENNLIKSAEDIAVIAEGGKLIGRILREVGAAAKPGVSTADLNMLAEKKILAVGGIPAFKGYGPKNNPFPAALCTSVNDAVVHGIPSKTAILKDGDIVSLDIGMEYKGLFTDTAITVGVGKISAEAERLLRATEKALTAAIAAAQVGKTTGDIGAATQAVIDAAGFSVVRDLVGHGVGYEVHEDPQVPGYGRPGSGTELKAGMVLAIEPMVNVGSYRIAADDDGWTIRTSDGMLSAHFEHTVAITEKGPVILTI